MSFFENNLKQLDPNLRILELGSGSGLLFDKISHIPFKSYTAVDVSENDIKKFEASLKEEQKKRVRLICSSIQNLNKADLGDYDVVISAGLIDWLDFSELQKVAQISKDKLFMHSFSEKVTTSIPQIIHRLYQRFSIMRKGTNVRSRYHSKEEILKIFKNSSTQEIKVTSYPRGSFGRVITNFPQNSKEIREYFDGVADNYIRKQNKLPWKILKNWEKQTYINLDYPIGAKVLNVGAGADELIQILKNDYQCQIVQMDLSKRMLANTIIDSQKLQANFETYDFEEIKYDLILLIGVLEFFQNPTEALKKASGLLSAKGKLILFVPQKTWLTLIYSYFHKKNRISISRFEESALELEISKFGLKVVSKQNLANWSLTIVCQKI